VVQLLLIQNLLVLLQFWLRLLVVVVVVVGQQVELARVLLVVEADQGVMQDYLCLHHLQLIHIQLAEEELEELLVVMMVLMDQIQHLVLLLCRQMVALLEQEWQVLLAPLKTPR
jgi:hypothetical protein